MCSEAQSEIVIAFCEQQLSPGLPLGLIVSSPGLSDRNAVVPTSTVSSQDGTSPGHTRPPPGEEPFPALK